MSRIIEYLPKTFALFTKFQEEFIFWNTVTWNILRWEVTNESEILSLIRGGKQIDKYM